MRRALYLAAAIAVSAAAPIVSLTSTPVAAQTATNAEEQSIRAIHERWAGLIVNKDAPSIEQLYADDAVLMAPGEAAVVGAKAIGSRWSRQLQLDGFAFSLKPEQLVVSASGDLAYDRGTYDFAAKFAQGPITDTGKYVLVWQKTGSDWKVISDIFNSNPAPDANLDQ